MAISKLTGPMLSNVLVRDGQPLAFSDSANATPVLYIDVANARIGVNTTAPTTDFTINGAGYASSLNLTNSISLGGNVIANGNVYTANISVSGNVTTVNLEATGFANAVNISASGNINAFANIVSGNVNTVNLEATGFANAVNISASGNINAFANIVGGNVNAGNLTSTSNLNVSGEANISLLNVTNISVSGNISGNVTTSTTGNIEAGNLSITGQAVLGNIKISNVTLSALGNIVNFAGNSGVAVPVGNTSQRPSTPPAGTVRFNTENNDLETWNGTSWVNTSTQTTQILDQQITGNNGTTYALTYPVTDNNNIIVTINGTTQLPGVAYNVVGTDIVFASALLTSDIADIRYLTYPVPVGDYGNANVAAYLATNTGNIAAGNIFTDNYLYANGTPVNFGSGSNYSNANVIAYANGSWAGNLIPSANVTYSLGNATNQWKDLWVSNNTIYIDSVPITVGAGNTLQVGGANVITANSSTTGNITATYFIGDGSQLTNLPAGNTSFLANSTATLTLGTDGTLLTASAGTSANFVVSNTTPDIDLRTASGTGLFTQGNTANITSEGNITVTSHSHNWVFGADANLAIPGSLISNGSSPAPLLKNFTFDAASGIISSLGQAFDISAKQSATTGVGYNLSLAAGSGVANVGGNVNIVAGFGDSAANGNITLSSGPNTWSFDNAGNLLLPVSGNLNLASGGITQSVQNYDLGITAYDTSDNDNSILNTINYGNGVARTQTSLNASRYRISTDIGGAGYNWDFDTQGRLNVPGNIALTPQGENISLYAVDNGTSGSAELKTISYSNDTLLSNVRSSANAVTISTANVAYTWSFNSQGDLYFPGNTIAGADIEGTGNFGFETPANVGFAILANAGGQEWTFDVSGNLKLPSNGLIKTNSGNVTIKASGETSGGSTAGNSVIIQGGNTGTSDGGHIILVSGSAPGAGGYAGNVNIIAANGAGIDGTVTLTTAGGTWAFDGSGNLTLPGNTFAVNYANGTQVSINGGGSANTGDVTFDVVTVQGVSGFGLKLSPSVEDTGNLKYLQVRSGDVDSHIHFDTGNNSAYDIFVGDDNKFVQVSNTGNIILSSYNGNTSYRTTLDTAGNLNIPGNISVGNITSVSGTNESGFPGGAGGPTFTADLNVNPGIDQVQLGWTVTGNNLVGVTTVTAIGTSGSLYEFFTDTGVTNPFQYNAVYTFASPVTTWNISTGGSLTLPSISLGNSQNEQTVVRSQRTIIPAFRWSAEIANTTPTVVYTATDNTITSMKVTIQIQHTGLGMEFFEVFATIAGSDTYYSVNNRVAPPSIAESTVVVGLAVGNAMKITVTINSGAATSWVTYNAVEFGIPND